MRLFVAVNLPATEKRRLAGVLDKLRAHNAAVRWVDADSLHITLKFLGEVKEENVGGVETALQQAAAGIHPFKMTIGGFGAFPSASRPRVFWIGIDAPAGLTRLQENVEEFIEPLGFPREKRAFSPHLTLGRARNDARVSAGEMDRFSRDVVYKAVVEVNSVEVMRSHLGPRGARYEVLHSVDMRGTTK